MLTRKVFYALLISTAAALISAEAGLRLLGYKPYPVLQIPFVKCNHNFVHADNYLGFAYYPGCFNCSINGLPFSLTQGADSFRITSDSPHLNVPQIHIYGCSITWGHGLSDSATMAWKLQGLLPHWHIKNYGIGAGSDLQAYLELRKNILNHDIPGVVILNYASFHDMRNAMTWPWRQLWQQILTHERPNDNSWSSVHIPYARLDSKGELTEGYMNEKELLRGVPFIRYSALCNLLNEAYQKYSDRNVNEADITIGIMQKMAALCRDNHIRFIVVEIVKDNAADKIVQRLKDLNIETADLSVDIRKKEFNLQPYDGHPNGRANGIYAAKLAELLADTSVQSSN